MRSAIALGLVVVSAIAGCAESTPPPQTAGGDPNVMASEDPGHNQATPTWPYKASQPSTGDLMPKTALSDPEPPAAIGAKTAAPLSDGEILGVLMAANKGEVMMAEIALSKGKSDAVKEFATMMKQHHQDGVSKTKGVAQKTKIAAAESDVSTHLQKDVSDMAEGMKTKRGAELDAAYMDAQVKAHKAVLQTIDDRLTPSAQNSQVAALVHDTKRIVEAHLNRAIDVDKKIGSSISLLTPKQAQRTAAR